MRKNPPPPAYHAHEASFLSRPGGLSDVAGRNNLIDRNINPIDDTNGKFLKRPDYWKLEPKIKALLDERSVQAAPLSAISD